MKTSLADGPAAGEASVPAFIALGSNIEPRRHLPEAVARLAERLAVEAVSRVYASPAVGGGGRTDRPDFLNAAVLARTSLPPAALKWQVLRPIEAELGRVRTGDPNASRTIDLDLALYGDRVVDDDEAALTLPDPEILTRPYVARPLADLAPAARHPVTGETLAEIAARLADASRLEIVDLDLDRAARSRGRTGDLSTSRRCDP